jgi:hypothetical protein
LKQSEARDEKESVMIDQGMHRITQEIKRLRLPNARRTLKRKRELTWWLIYGPPRCGTSYMVRMVKACSMLYVSDWGLAPILNPIPKWLRLRSSPDFGYIKFDYERFLRGISDNILDNAYPGTGSQLDFVYKQATLGLSQYEVFVKMWGPPERTVFCFREPAGYIVSAVNKFIYDTVERLQQLYVRSMNSYQEIGGDVFEYTPELTMLDYFSFLEPLEFEGKWTPLFQFKGEQDHEHTTNEMWDAYHRIMELTVGKGG